MINLKSGLVRLFLIAAFASAFHGAAVAQQISLLCVTKYSDFVNNIRDVAVDGVIVKVTGKNVNVINAAEFSSNNLNLYETTVFGDDSIRFKNKSKPLYSGFINRYSGKISISEWSDDEKRLLKLLEGNCELANKKF